MWGINEKLFNQCLYTQFLLNIFLVERLKLILWKTIFSTIKVRTTYTGETYKGLIAFPLSGILHHNLCPEFYPNKAREYMRLL